MKLFRLVLASLVASFAVAAYAGEACKGGCCGKDCKKDAKSEKKVEEKKG